MGTIAIDNNAKPITPRGKRLFTSLLPTKRSCKNNKKKRNLRYYYSAKDINDPFATYGSISLETEQSFFYIHPPPTKTKKRKTDHTFMTFLESIPKKS